MKTKQDNDVTESIGVIYVKNNIELSWPTGSGADYDENQIRQLHDQLYRCGLRQKQNWVVMTNQTESSLWWKPDRTTMWPII